VAVNLKQIEARIAKLEAAHRANPLAGMTPEQLAREAIACMDRIAADYGGDYDATVAALRANPCPLHQKGADGFLWYMERVRKQAEYDAWCARTMAEQQAAAV
jgi:hypothetical protein